MKKIKYKDALKFDGSFDSGVPAISKKDAKEIMKNLTPKLILELYKKVKLINKGHGYFDAT